MQELVSSALMESCHPSLLHPEHKQLPGLLPPQGGHRGCMVSPGAGGKVLPQIQSAYLEAGCIPP